MRFVELNAVITENRAQRRSRRRTRASRALVTAALVFAFAWVIPVANISPSALDFGKVAVGRQSEWQRVTLTNHTSRDLRPVIHVEGGAVSEVQLREGVCSTIASGNTCFLQVGFYPRRAGQKHAVVKVSMDPELDDFSVDLTATAIGVQGIQIPPESVPTPVPSIRLEPQSLNFTARSRRTQQIRVENDGRGPLHVSNVTLLGTDRDDFAIDPAGCVPQIEIQPGGDCLITVHYKVRFHLNPKTEYVAVLSIKHDAPNLGTPQIIDLRWQSNEPPRPLLTLEPKRLDFSGKVRDIFPTQTVTIRNVGDIPAKDLNFNIGNHLGGEHGPFDYSSNCNQLQPGQECTVDVTFLPIPLNTPSASVELLERSNQSRTFQEYLVLNSGAGEAGTVSLHATVKLSH